MAKISLDQLPLIDLTNGIKQSFARKVVVVAYYLEDHKSGAKIPHFLFTVIAPKQPEKVTDDWHKAKKFKLPSGFSLIKGTREMIHKGKTEDIPPKFGGYFRKMVSGNLKKKDRDSRINGLVPAAITALKESKEEGGVKTSNIEVLYDLGVRKIKISGRPLKVNTFAIELKKTKNGKAIDSLVMEYFTLGELKLAAKQRTRYNIPLVRPSHVRFVEDVLDVLRPKYKEQGLHLSKKTVSKKKQLRMIKERKALFLRLIKDARGGEFKAHKHSPKKTIKNIIAKSQHSRERQKKAPRLK